MSGIAYDTAVMSKIVIDSNVFISALRSSLGASYRLLSLIGTGRFEIFISVPLIIEYEDVAKRQSRQIGLNYNEIDEVIDYICKVGNHQTIFFLWRPLLKDPKDDLVLELAVEANCDYIVTFNKRDFEGAEMFNVKVISPGEFLRIIGEIK